MVDLATNRSFTTYLDDGFASSNCCLMDAMASSVWGCAN